MLLGVGAATYLTYLALATLPHPPTLLLQDSTHFSPRNPFKSESHYHLSIPQIRSSTCNIHSHTPITLALLSQLQPLLLVYTDKCGRSWEEHRRYEDPYTEVVIEEWLQELRGVVPSACHPSHRPCKLNSPCSASNPRAIRNLWRTQSPCPHVLVVVWHWPVHGLGAAGAMQHTEKQRRIHQLACPAPRIWMMTAWSSA